MAACEHPLSIPQQSARRCLGGHCLYLGFAMPVKCGKVALPVSPCEAFPSCFAQTFLQVLTQHLPHCQGLEVPPFLSPGLLL